MRAIKAAAETRRVRVDEIEVGSGSSVGADGKPVQEIRTCVQNINLSWAGTHREKIKAVCRRGNRREDRAGNKIAKQTSKAPTRGAIERSERTGDKSFSVWLQGHRIN